MRVLIANLTLLCQCVFQWWVVTALAVLFVLLCLFPDVVNAEAVLAALLLVPLGLGMAIASLQDAVTSRVGLFCLPRPQGERRRLALLLGSFAAFCAVLVFIGYVDRFDVPPHRRFLVSGSIFAASLLLCCSGAAAPLLAGCLFIGGPMILHGVISLFAPSWPSVSTLLELAIIDYPGSVIAMSMVATAFSWVWLARPINDLRYPPTRPSTKRNATQRFFADVLDKAERKDAIHPWINAVLLERMRRSPHTRTAKHVWSSLYLWLHPRGGGRAELILGIVLGVVLTVVCWYADFVFLLVLGAMILFEGHRYALHSPLMTIGGRRERFLSTMVQLAVSGGVFALSVIVSFAALDGLQGYLPGSGTRALHAELDLVSLDWGSVLLALAFWPLSCCAEIVLRHPLRKRDIPLWPGAIVVAMIVDFSAIEIPLVWATAAVVSSWMICAAGIYLIARRADLLVTVRPEPTFSTLWRAICETAAGQRNRGVQ